MQNSQVPDKAIRELQEVLDRECVRSIAAQNREMVERWQSDYVSYLCEGKSVNKISDVHLPLVERATLEWVERFSRFINVFGGSESNFILWFIRVRSAVRAGELDVHQRPREGKYDLLHRSTELARGVVWNVSWPIAFASYLPRALPDKELALSAIGFQMSAIMWLETLAKTRRPDEPFQAGKTYELERYAKVDALLDICEARLN